MHPCCLCPQLLEAWVTGDIQLKGLHRVLTKRQSHARWACNCVSPALDFQTQPEHAVLSALLAAVQFITNSFQTLRFADVPLAGFQQSSELSSIFRDLITAWSRYYDEGSGLFAQVGGPEMPSS